MNECYAYRIPSILIENFPGTSTISIYIHLILQGEPQVYILSKIEKLNKRNVIFTLLTKSPKSVPVFVYFNSNESDLMFKLVQ